VVKTDKALDQARRQMAQRLAASGVSHHEVLQAIATVPRHAFIFPGLVSQAYE
jgi:protein-L-isoaspartate(D-aspartate) O-methyltransferase